MVNTKNDGLHDINYWSKSGKQPLVTIFCTTYNHEDYIKDALNSFISQETSFPYEILINDDCSSDATVNIIQKYVDRYVESIHLVTHEMNYFSLGVNNIGEFLYPVAKGKYFAFCEGDDYWIDRSKLQRQFEILENDPDIGFCGHASYNIDSSSKKVLGEMRPFQQDCYVDFGLQVRRIQLFATASFFVRRELYERYLASDISRMSAHGDYKMSLFYGALSKVFYIDAFMSAYRVFSRSSINRQLAMNEGVESVQLKLRDSRIELLDAVDALTDGIWHSCIEDGKSEVEYQYYLATRQGKIVLSRYGKRLSQERLRTKAIVWLESVCPAAAKALLRARAYVRWHIFSK